MYMRLIRPDDAVETADRALTLAERHNLDDVAAEALINKGSALSLLGRRREATFLQEGAVQLSAGGGSVARELRARHNLAVQLIEDEPVHAREQLETTLDLARRVGDRGHYSWIIGSLTFLGLQAGERLDERAALLREVLDTSVIKVDRGRLRGALAFIETARGENLDAILADMQEIFGDTTDSEEIFYRDSPTAWALLARGDYEGAYRAGMAVAELQSQLPEFGLAAAYRAAVALTDLERLRPVLARTLALPQTGAGINTLRSRMRAAVAALESRLPEALTEFRGTLDVLRARGDRYDLATVVVDAVTLVPDEPEVWSWVEEARPILEEIRAAPDLARLDEIEGTRAGDSSATSAPSVADVTRSG